MTFWISLAVLALTGLILWRYTRGRNLMDVSHSDFVQPAAVRDKLLISLAVLALSLLFAATHIRQLMVMFTPAPCRRPSPTPDEWRFAAGRR
ncbi:MAG: hypothetical protein K0R86_1986 [Enterobacter kobei]|nr:hypothetical protein [Enterobacter kobei]